MKHSIANRHPQSIILIRIRQRPVLRLPSSNNNPTEIFTNILKQMKDHSKSGIHVVKKVPLSQWSNTDSVNGFQINRIIIHRDKKRTSTML